MIRFKRANNSLLKNDHLCDWSPEKDCCRWLKFRQPVSTGCHNISCEQHSFSGLWSPRWSFFQSKYVTPGFEPFSYLELLSTFMWYQILVFHFSTDAAPHFLYKLNLLLYLFIFSCLSWKSAFYDFVENPFPAPIERYLGIIMSNSTGLCHQFARANRPNWPQARCTGTQVCGKSVGRTKCQNSPFISVFKPKHSGRTKCQNRTALKLKNANFITSRWRKN